MNDRTPPTARQTTASRVDRVGLTVMTSEECWQRLASEPMGRVAINVDGRPHLVPVNHVVRNREILFVSVAGTKTHAALEQPGLPAAFEVDCYDASTETGWSVVVQGELTAIEDEVDHARLERLGRPIWIAGVNDRRWLRVLPEHVNGRHLHTTSTPT